MGDEQYLELVRDILLNGVKKQDRTGVCTLSVVGRSMRFSLKDGQIPLLTTKRMFWRGIVEELLWFISGSTDANVLREKGIHIWDGHGSKEYLASIGLKREEGDLGPVYGFQWRHFGATYRGVGDYKGEGFDQLAAAVKLIRTEPASRRIIISAWNPPDLAQMALPPCHLLMQFFVHGGELNCILYQRSGDVGLGVPFNMASYGLLTHLMAHVCGLHAGELVHMIGDAHIYLNHVDALKEQLTRTPLAPPKLALNPEVRDLDQFKLEDITLVDYQHHKHVPMKMAL